MLHSRLGPGDESLQNKARRSILTSKLYFVFVTKSTQQKSKTKFFKIIYFKTSLSYPNLTYRSRFDVALKALGIACIRTW